MLNKENKTVNGLWIGKQLSVLELLTLKSFVKHGHIFHLWVYSEIVNELPEEVVLKDANSIIPEEEIIVRKFNDPVTGVGKGSVGAPFSDLFRYKLLYEQGGWWVDMDVTCLKPLNIEEPYFFRDHLQLKVIGNVLKCPKHSELMKKTYNEVRNTCDENTLDWLLPNKILNKNIEYEGLMRFRQKDCSNLDNWKETIGYIRKNKTFPENWFVFHWSNEEWRMQGLDKNNLRMRNSTLGKLLLQYSISTNKAKLTGLIKNEIILSWPYQFGKSVITFVYYTIRYYFKKNKA